MENATILLVDKQPFYANLLHCCVFIWDESIETAGVRVNGKGQVELRVSKNFFYKLPELERAGLLQHEMLHIMLGHLDRKRNYDHHIANIAMDLAINQHIEKDWFPQMGLSIEQEKFQHLKPNEAFEVYYVELMQKKEDYENLAPLDNHGSEPGDGSGEGNGDSNSELDDEIKKAAIDSIITQAYTKTKAVNPGNIPLHIQKMIEERFKPARVDWKRELRSYMGRKQSTAFESTRTRPNRRFGLAAPGKKRDYVPSILIGVDISGSVTDEHFQMFMNEIKTILKDRDDKTEIVFFDTAICEYKLKVSQLKEMPKRPGYGGTDFQPVFDYAATVKPDLLIVLTDGEAPAPKDVRFPVLWALVGNYHEHLKGKKVFLELPKKSKR